MIALVYTLPFFRKILPPYPHPEGERFLRCARNDREYARYDSEVARYDKGCGLVVPLRRGNRGGSME